MAQNQEIPTGVTTILSFDMMCNVFLQFVVNKVAYYEFMTKGLVLSEITALL